MQQDAHAGGKSLENHRQLLYHLLMKKKVTYALFVIAAAAGIVAFVSRMYISKPQTLGPSYSVVVPQSGGAAAGSSSGTASSDEDSALVSLIPLHSDETLISMISTDLDGDGYDDQVNAVRTMASPYLSIIIGMYNPRTSSYERTAVLATEISQAQTFSYTGIDLTGEHRVSLVYQGFAENGDSVLKAFFVSGAGGRFSLRNIADLRGDGTVFIQQLDRYDAYERSKANGASFPIWVYASDTENPGSTDQLQIQYEWNPAEQRYTQTKTVRVAGSRIAAKELARIQDGTVSTFAHFLNGLWYMSEGSDSGKRYLFFDYGARELIFFKDDTEEVYSWVHSNLRRNGMYLSAVNQGIENLQRRVDISLKSTDEIHVRIQDDVRMLISESAVWDGSYRKTEKKAVPLRKEKTERSRLLKTVLEKARSWNTSDGLSLKLQDGTYLFSGDLFSESGVYTGFEMQGESFVQFRPQPASAASRLSGLYRIEAEKPSPSGEERCRLQPCMLFGSGITVLETRPVVLSRPQEKDGEL